MILGGDWCLGLGGRGGSILYPCLRVWDDGSVHSLGYRSGWYRHGSGHGKASPLSFRKLIASIMEAKGFDPLVTLSFPSALPISCVMQSSSYPSNPPFERARELHKCICLRPFRWQPSALQIRTSDL